MESGPSNSWAEALIDELAIQGVQHLCLAPGSRNLPLAVAAAGQPLLRITVHFDERALGFFALGIARASKRPVVLLVTSGTAVGNLMPAVMEAHHDSLPLLLLTADRPPELRHCGANQATDQVNLFGNFVRWQTDLPPASEKTSLAFLRQTVAYALHLATGDGGGPVQLNCMFREPFTTQELLREPPQPITLWKRAASHLPHSEAERLSEKLLRHEKGLILVGSEVEVEAALLSNLARSLGWPLLTDAVSGVRSCCDPAYELRYFEALLPKLKPTLLLQIGNRFIGRPFLTWLQQQKEAEYLQIVASPFREDPAHLVTERWEMEPASWIENLLPHLPSKRQSDWLDELQEASQQIHETLFSWLAEQSEMTEPALFLELARSLPPTTPFWTGSSMPARDAQSFLFPQERAAPIYGNRALSGIDGNIASIFGAALATGKRLVAVLGDQTILHDLTSLSFGAKFPSSLLLIAINNGGGGIFSLLPIGNNRPLCETYFAAAHEMRLEGAATMFGWRYASPHSLPELRQLLTQSMQEEGNLFIELFTCRHQNAQLHRALTEQLQSIQLTHSDVGCESIKKTQ